MSLRRASVSMSAMRVFFAPASTSTSRTLSASCSSAAATALMPAIQGDCLVMSVRLLLSLGGLAAFGEVLGRFRLLLRGLAALHLALLDQPEIDLALLQTGLEHAHAGAVAKAVFVAAAVPGEGAADGIEAVEIVRQLGHVHQAVDLGFVQLNEQPEAGDAADDAVEHAAHVLFHPCRAVAVVDLARGLVGAPALLRTLQRQADHLAVAVLEAVLALAGQRVLDGPV